MKAVLRKEVAPQPAPKKIRKVQAASAVEMGAKQREISVSEFFTKNRHLLGFDNPRKALLTCVKEAVDNSLDACEEAGILPEIQVRVRLGQVLIVRREAVAAWESCPSSVRVWDSLFCGRARLARRPSVRRGSKRS